MDAGEGQNGKCDDCISGETKRQENEKKVNEMVRSTKYYQMSLEEFINA
jgi:hypothetical protein